MYKTSVTVSAEACRDSAVFEDILDIRLAGTECSFALGRKDYSVCKYGYRGSLYIIGSDILSFIDVCISLCCLEKSYAASRTDSENSVSVLSCCGNDINDVLLDFIAYTDLLDFLLHCDYVIHMHYGFIYIYNRIVHFCSFKYLYFLIH